MSNVLKNTLLGIPIFVWIAQALYVVGSLSLFVILLHALNIGSVPSMSAQLFAVIYVLVMLAADIVWRLAIKKNRIAIVALSIIAAVIIDIGVAQLLILQSAHSSFDNYYKFRGCSELITRSADSATCKLPSGETIKIVKYQNKWYLNGDLPDGWFNFN